MRIPFRRGRKSVQDGPAPAETPPAEAKATLEPAHTMPETTTAPAPTTTVMAETPLPAPLGAHNGRLAGSLRSQVGSSDLRAERLVRQLRGQLDELRERIDGRAVPEQMTLVDIAAVAANPEAAAELPPSLLVRTLLDSYRQMVELQERVADQRGKIGALSARIREMDTERAFARGRMQTLEDVIAALHANLEDLRLLRDGGARPLPLAPGPRALRPSDQATVEALPGVEEA